MYSWRPTDRIDSTITPQTTNNEGDKQVRNTGYTNPAWEISTKSITGNLILPLSEYEDLPTFLKGAISPIFTSEFHTALISTPPF